MSKKELYVNLYDYLDDDYPYQIFIGGRGIGKTHSILRESLTHCNGSNKFIYMRRTDKELTLLMDTKKGEGVGNPFKKLNSMYTWNFGILKIFDSVGGIFKRELDEQNNFIYAQQVGYAIALSTIAGIRGVDFSDCTDLIFDEFIPEIHVQKISNEGFAFLNAVETINRNRELDGEKPLRVWLLSNSTNIEHDLLRTLGLVNVIERMKKRGIEHQYFKDRGLAIHLFGDSTQFVEKKQQTSLYKLTKGTDFYDFSLSNDFVFNDDSLVEFRQLKGYVPFIQIDNAYCYRKKGETDVYVTYARNKVAWKYDTKHEQDRLHFKEHYGIMFRNLFTNQKIHFESYELKSVVLNMLLG